MAFCALRFTSVFSSLSPRMAAAWWVACLHTGQHQSAVGAEEVHGPPYGNGARARKQMQTRVRRIHARAYSAVSATFSALSLALQAPTPDTHQPATSTPIHSSITLLVSLRMHWSDDG